MIILSLALVIFGIGFFCWLLFTLAVFALPLPARSAGSSSVWLPAAQPSASGSSRPSHVLGLAPLVDRLRLRRSRDSGRL